VPGHEFQSYEETDEHVVVRFANGEAVVADILVGADGIRSKVSKQAFGDPQLFHVGLRVWLASCEQFEGVPPETGVLHHSRNIQASYFPMMHNGKPGFEWWIVEPVEEHDKGPSNVEAHVRNLLDDFVEPMPLFPDHTNFETQIFRWDVYNRPSLKKWTKGRLAFVGDSVHPVSPYAAYGMGMAIEDSYFLARALGGRDLNDRGGIDAAFARYNDERVDYSMNSWNSPVRLVTGSTRRPRRLPGSATWFSTARVSCTGRSRSKTGRMRRKLPVN
jgi:2-polyprenyl-6-methoxyphenol hydroxylase-like FAD-dependent oxidoreductase